MILRIQIHLSGGRTLGCICTTIRYHAIGGSERIVEKQPAGFILKDRPDIQFGSPTFGRTYSVLSLIKSIEVIDRFGHFCTVAARKDALGLELKISPIGRVPASCSRE